MYHGYFVYSDNSEYFECPEYARRVRTLSTNPVYFENPEYASAAVRPREREGVRVRVSGLHNMLRRRNLLDLRAPRCRVFRLRILPKLKIS